jgi:hypothetical protein
MMPSRTMMMIDLTTCPNCDQKFLDTRLQAIADAWADFVTQIEDALQEDTDE